MIMCVLSVQSPSYVRRTSPDHVHLMCIDANGHGKASHEKGDAMSCA